MNILEHLKAPIVKVDCGGHTIYLKRPNARNNMKMYEQQKNLPEDSPPLDSVLTLITYMLVDENGKLLLEPGTPESIEVVNDFPPQVFHELMERCTEMTSRPLVEETKKN